MPASRVSASIRSAGCMRGHGPVSKAARAASTARFTSAGPALAAWPMTASLCGDITEMTESDCGAVHLPSMKSWSLSYIFFPGPSLGVATAVDAEYLAGDVAGLFRYEERACGGDVFRPAYPTHRCAGDVVLHGAA